MNKNYIVLAHTPYTTYYGTGINLGVSERTLSSGTKRVPGRLNYFSIDFIFSCYVLLYMYLQSIQIRCMPNTLLPINHHRFSPMTARLRGLSL